MAYCAPGFRCIAPTDHGARIAEMRIQAAQHGGTRFLVELHGLSNQLNYLCHRLNAAGYEAKLFTQVDAALGWL
jgi:hypothetical protein